MLVIGLPTCRWLFGMALVYPAGGTVTISKKSPLIRILSKGRDCIDFEKNVKTRLCRGRRPRRPAEGSTLGGAQRAPPVRFANPLVRLFAPQGQTLLAPRFRFAQPWPRARNPATLPCKSIEKWGCGHKLAGRAYPAPTRRCVWGGNKNYLSILHVSRLLVISPWISTDTRSTRAAGSSFMPVRTHSSVRPTKAYL